MDRSLWLDEACANSVLEPCRAGVSLLPGAPLPPSARILAQPDRNLVQHPGTPGVIARQRCLLSRPGLPDLSLYFPLEPHRPPVPLDIQTLPLVSLRRGGILWGT